MSIIEDIRKTHPSHYFYAMVGFAGVLAPGFLVLYVFKPNLIIDIDVFKLLIFSASLSVPVVLLNFLTIYFFRKDVSEKGPTVVLFGAVLTTAMVLFLSIFAAYIFHFKFIKFLLLGTALDILFLLPVIFL